jgi:hypothetical protein
MASSVRANTMRPSLVRWVRWHAAGAADGTLRPEIDPAGGMARAERILELILDGLREASRAPGVTLCVRLYTRSVLVAHCDDDQLLQRSDHREGGTAEGVLLAGWEGR